MSKKQPAPQTQQPIKRPVKPTEPTIPEQIAELLARALARINGMQVPAATV